MYSAIRRTVKANGTKTFAAFVMFFAALIMFAGSPCFAGSWYVSNTAPGEWIQYDKVWLTAGSYRFTANAGSPQSGATFQLEIDGVVVQANAAVPNTGAPDSFAYASLGNATVAQGYHTLRVVFESSGISMDWLMLHKSTDTSPQLEAADVVLGRPSNTGMLVSPIIAYNHASNANSIFNANNASYLVGDIQPYDAYNNNYSDLQMSSYYQVPMFEDFDRRTDRYWDIMLEMLMLTRSPALLFQCRPTSDFTDDLQDRSYQPGDGSFEGRWLQKLVEAISRSPQAASSLQIGMFLEDGDLAIDYQTTYGHYPTGWGDPTLPAYAMQYWLGPWLNQVPASLLYQVTPAAPIIDVYTGHPTNLPQDGQMGKFLTSLRSLIQAQYGLTPVFIVSPDADASADAVAFGVAPWTLFGGPLYTSNTFNGKNWGYTSAGSRKSLYTVWLNDWNPSTDIGTPCPPNVELCNSSGDDYFESPFDSKGNSILYTNYSNAAAAGTYFIHNEGFFDFPEGEPVAPSYAFGNTIPHQHLAATRQYADPSTSSMMFEAEGADEYYKVSVHTNLGGTYRNQWYTNTGLDVYEPLHNMNPWATHSTGAPSTLVGLSAGFFDVWALDNKGQIWDHGIADGTTASTWTTVAMNGVPKFTQLAVGKHDVWALNGTMVYTAALPYSYPSNAHTSWVAVSGNMIQLAVDEAEVWAIDANGLLYKQRVNAEQYPGDSWAQISGPGPALTGVYVGGNSKLVWAMSGNNIYYTTKANISWTAVPNPYNLTSLSVGSQEVWGVNSAGNVYRRSVSGIGNWVAVSGSFNQIALGENYAWALQGATPSSLRLTGFLGAPAAQIPTTPMGLSVSGNPNGQASLTWTTVLGAAGYNVKRATTSVGPYTTVTMPTANTVTDSGLAGATTYYYVVSAFNALGESANSQQVIITTPAFTMTPSVASFGQTSVVVSGVALRDSFNIVSLAPFVGTVNISCAISNTVPPNTATGTCSVTPSVMLSSGGAAPATLTINTSAGTSGILNVTVTGTSGSSVSSVVIPVVLTASSFSVIANGPATVMTVGGATVNNTATITVASVNSFAGPVSFSCTAVDAGSGGKPQGTCTASPVTLMAGNTAVSTVALNSSPGTNGVLSLIVTGTGTTAGASLSASATCGSLASPCITAILATPFTMNVASIPPINSGATSGNTSIVTMNSQAGFSGSVSLACTLTASSGLAPAYPATCSVTPNSVNLNSTSSTLAIVTISSHVPVAQNRIPTMQPNMSRWPSSVVALALFGLSIRRRRRFEKLALMICMTLGIGLIVGCGGTTTQSTNTSSAGTYVLTVEGNVGAFTTSSSTSVTIQ